MLYNCTMCPRSVTHFIQQVNTWNGSLLLGYTVPSTCHDQVPYFCLSINTCKLYFFRHSIKSFLLSLQKKVFHVYRVTTFLLLYNFYFLIENFCLTRSKKKHELFIKRILLLGLRFFPLNLNTPLSLLMRGGVLPPLGNNILSSLISCINPTFHPLRWGGVISKISIHFLFITPPHLIKSSVRPWLYKLVKSKSLSKSFMICL